MTAHNIACQKCMFKADFYINEDNILDDIRITHMIYQREKGKELHFKVITICPNCDEIYILDGSL